MIRDQFRQMVGPQQRAVDQRLPMLPGHLALLVDLENGQHLRFSPRRVELLPLPFAPPLFLPAFALFPQPDPSAVDLHDHSPPGKFVPGRKLSRPPSQQFTLPQCQHLRSQLFGNAADGLLVQVDSLPGQFLTCYRDRRAEGHDPRHGVLQGRTASLYRIPTPPIPDINRPVALAALSCPLARSWCTVPCAEEQNQTAEQTYLQGT